MSTLILIIYLLFIYLLLINLLLLIIYLFILNLPGFRNVGEHFRDFQISVCHFAPCVKLSFLQKVFAFDEFLTEIKRSF